MGKKKLSDRAKNAAKDLVLARILLEGANFKRNYPNRPTKAEIKLDVETGVLDNAPSSIFFRCRFILDAVNKGTDDIVFESDTSFIAEYNKIRKRRFGNKELEAFGLISVVYNTWPYLREIIQNMIIRTGLPSLTLNPIKIADLIQMAESGKGTYITG